MGSKLSAYNYYNLIFTPQENGEEDTMTTPDPPSMFIVTT